MSHDHPLCRDDDACPTCGEADGAKCEAQDGRLRICCTFCGHSKERYMDLDLAWLEWIASSD